MQNTVLILGARGRFGLTAARAFAQAGWRVLGQMRPGDRAVADSPVQWLAVDLHDTQALARAAAGAQVVVHALNPAYTNQAWRAAVLPMLEGAIAIAGKLGATLMVPGNVYNYGKSMPSVLREDTPQTSDTVKGLIRIAMEARLEHCGVRSVVIRAGNFFGGGRGTMFDSAMVKDIRKGHFTDPGTPGVSTAWAYLPDLAQTFVAVAQRRAALGPYAVFHFAGHNLTDQLWLQALTPIARQQGWVKPGAEVGLRAFPWALIRVGAWFMPLWAALVEMRYLSNTPHALANDKLTALIGPEPHTPLEPAVRAALADLGFLTSTTHQRA